MDENFNTRDALTGIGQLVSLSNSLRYAEKVLKGLAGAEQAQREVADATDKSRDELAAVHAEIAAAKERAAKLPDHDATLKRLQREISATEARLADLRGEAVQLRTDNAEAARLLGERKALAAEIAGKLGALAGPPS